MEREILFRGKHKDNSEWKYGDLIHAVRRSETVCWIKEGSGDFGRQTYAVNPDTVGQFTGLHDGNRQRIFEGDICAVRYRYSALSEFRVVFRDGAWTLLNKNGKHYIPLYSVLKMDIGVIGNVHDAPEFLTA